MRVELAFSDPKHVEAACQAGARAVERQENALLITSMPEDRLQILRAIETAGGVVVRFASQEPSLEDIYLQYTGSVRTGDGH